MRSRALSIVLNDLRSLMIPFLSSLVFSDCFSWFPARRIHRWVDWSWSIPRDLVPLVKHRLPGKPRTISKIRRSPKPSSFAWLIHGDYFIGHCPAAGIKLLEVAGQIATDWVLFLLLWWWWLFSCFSNVVVITRLTTVHNGRNIPSRSLDGINA